MRYPQVHLTKASDPKVPRTRSADIPTGPPNKRCGRQIHSLSCREARARGNFYDWSMVFSLTCLILWFWSVVLHLKYWTPVLGPLYWLSMVLVHGLSNGLSIKMKGDHLAEQSWVEYLKVSEIWNTCDRLVSDSWIRIKEKPEHYKMDLLMGRDLFGAWSDL